MPPSFGVIYLFAPKFTPIMITFLNSTVFTPTLVSRAAGARNPYYALRGKCYKYFTPSPFFFTSISPLSAFSPKKDPLLRLHRPRRTSSGSPAHQQELQQWPLLLTFHRYLIFSPPPLLLVFF